MIQIILAVFVVAFLIFSWLKNKQYNRNVDRHSRMIDKQEELMKLIKDKKESNEQDTNNTPSDN